MSNTEGGIIRTLRCKFPNKSGINDRLIDAINRENARIDKVSVVHKGRHYAVSDIEVRLADADALTKLLERLSALKDVTIVRVMDDILKLHQNGKIGMTGTVPVDSISDLRKVYTPGVAEVCKLIQAHPEWKDHYTSIPYTIAIVTDGTAILGLGNIGAVAGMPVMEGKSALMYQFAGVRGIPILLDTTDTEEVIATIKHIAPTFGAIHMEDFASPRCFEIEERLEKELDIPVMQDDQQGTAVVVIGSLINACKIAGIELGKAKIGMIGLGAAGLIIGEFIRRFTGNPTLGTARTEASIQRHVSRGGIAANFDEIMKKADIVICTSGVSGLIKPEMIRKGQIIFALTNPFPEIMPDQAMAAGAAIATDGRTVNNLVGYPGIWRGTLDAGAKKINWEMYRAAIMAVAGAAPKGELIPSPLDPKVHLAVTKSVARAAMESGAAQRQMDEDYFEDTELRYPLDM
ncbi:MAG: NAD-dependent malic enzyme [Dehalococcoidales bacterium]|nr:NAD-dependent malic enzyme [Dehalococcoidales bacterium]